MNSRSKGNRNERRAAELITLWTGRKFSKTPASGGLQWKKSFSKGDIVCTKEGHFFPFCVEVKAHREINFSELLMTGKVGVKILEFWQQCKRDAAACCKVPMLMMRYDRMPSDMFFLAFPNKFYEYLYTSFIATNPFPTNLLFYRSKHNNFVVMDSRQFFKIVPYKQFKYFTKLYLKNAKEKTR